MNKNIFKSKMKLFRGTNVTLASAIGLSPQRLSAKINETGGTEFTQMVIGNSLMLSPKFPPPEPDMNLSAHPALDCEDIGNRSM